MRRFYVLLTLVLCSVFVSSQEYTRKDTLRGKLTPIRTCYDVTFYDLNLFVDEQERSIERSTNIIHFTALENFTWFQIDLASNMEVMIVEFEGNKLEFNLEFDAVYIYFNRKIKKGEQLSIKVWYGG